MRALVAVATVLALLGGACGGDGETTTGPTSSRPPLDSPPDPGPVPVSDGLDDEVRERVVASTARVWGNACGRLSEGSAFAVAEDLVVTNAHVILGVEEVRLDLTDGRQATGEPVAYDPVADLAVLRVFGAELAPLPLGGATDGTTGALVGWEAEPAPDPTPFRIDRPVTVRIDIVGGTERVERPSWLLAADVEAGDSGAALVDGDGIVVGIAYATTTRDAGVGYAVRTAALEDLIAAGFSGPVTVPDC